MIWIALAAVAVVGIIVREIRIAPEVSEDYEVELWEKYRREECEGVAVYSKEPVRHNDAA